MKGMCVYLQKWLQWARTFQGKVTVCTKTQKNEKAWPIQQQ